jgi:myo-inositol catabolism protein IolH
MTACVFAWEERARESSVFMLEEMHRRTRDWKHRAAPAPH